MPARKLLYRSVYSSAYDADAQLYFDELTGTIPDAYKTAVSTLVTTLKADGNWSKLLRFWIMAAPNQQNATISLVNPTSTPMTEVSSPTWTQYEGYTGDGSSYINTNFNPTNDGSSLWLQDDASYGYYCITNIDELGAAMGAQDGIVYNSSFPRYSNSFYGEINGATFASVTNTSSLGFFSVVRTSSTEIDLFKNGSDQGVAGSQVSTGIIDGDLFLLARSDSGGSPQYNSTYSLAIAYTGAGDIDQSTFYTAIQTFATTIGFNV